MFKSLSLAVEIFKALVGFRSQGPTAYLKKGRLEDVLALIQVLAFHKNARRIEAGLKSELQGDPLSAKQWTHIAEDHPEFFRVSYKEKYPVSLVSRYVSDENVKKDPLSTEFTQSLFTTAIEIHDRQLKRAERWTYLIPIWVAVITGMFILGGTLISHWYSNKQDIVYKVEIVKPLNPPNRSQLTDSRPSEPDR